MRDLIKWETARKAILDAGLTFIIENRGISVLKGGEQVFLCSDPIEILTFMAGYKAAGAEKISAKEESFKEAWVVVNYDSKCVEGVYNTSEYTQAEAAADITGLFRECYNSHPLFDKNNLQIYKATLTEK